MFSKRHVPIAIAAALGVVASCCILALSLTWQLRVDRLAFRSQARAELALINSELQDAANLIETVRDFLESSQAPASRAEFGRFSQRVHDRAIGLRDVGWAPRVTDAERDDFERQIRASGVEDFEIKQRDGSGRLVRAVRKPEYYPILYLDGNPASRQLLGFDITGEAIRRSALEHAVLTGRTAATPPLTLLTVARPRGGVMSFMPVYRGERPISGKIPAAPQGVVFGAFEIATLLETVMAKVVRFNRNDIYLFDLNATLGDRLIFWRSSVPGLASTPTEQALRTGAHWEGRLTIIDQQWGAIFAPAGRGAIRWTWRAILPCFAGLLLTALTVLHLSLAQRRTTQLENLTRELHETTEGLHQTAEKVAHMARHDALTGLPNRRLFFEELERASGQAAAGNATFAVLQIDLDRFKPVNDGHGHAVGDAVLREVAIRLRAVLRGRDVLARLGGDEFAAILECEDVYNVSGHYAARILTALAQTIVVDGIELDIGGSIGIAIAPNDGTDPEALLKTADMAMYAAKRRGRGVHCFYEAGMEMAAPRRSQADVEAGHPDPAKLSGAMQSTTVL